MTQFLILSNIAINVKFIVEIEIETNYYNIYVQHFFKNCIDQRCIKVEHDNSDYDIVTAYLYPNAKIKFSAPEVQIAECITTKKID
jgi:hypothetical protein